MGIDNVITDDPVMAKELIYEQEHSTFWDRYVKQLLQIGSSDVWIENVRFTTYDE